MNTSNVIHKLEITFVLDKIHKIIGKQVHLVVQLQQPNCLEPLNSQNALGCSILMALLLFLCLFDHLISNLIIIRGSNNVEW
jgi:hypothetical protein